MTLNHKVGLLWFVSALLFLFEIQPHWLFRLLLFIVTVVFFYVTLDLREQERKVLDKAATYKAIFETTGTAMAIVDFDLNLVLANRQFKAKVCHDVDQDIANMPLSRYIYQSDLGAVTAYFNAFRSADEDLDPLEFKLVSQEMQIFDVQMFLSNYADGDGLVVSLIDITEKKAAYKRLEHYATHDKLTDLPNRRYFMDKLESAMVKAEVKGASIGILYVDIDDFKSINDTYGHHVGDLVLHELANRLQLSVPYGDIAARMGGDEFIVMLSTKSSLAYYKQVADNIIEELRLPFVVGKQELKLTVSIGLAVYPQDGTHLLSLIRNADQAMYSVKHSGKNNVGVYEVHDGERTKPTQKNSI